MLYIHIMNHWEGLTGEAVGRAAKHRPLQAARRILKWAGKLGTDKTVERDARVRITPVHLKYFW